MASEWKEWAKQFEKGGRSSQVDNAIRPATCLYAVREFSHKVACNDIADYRSPDNYPACGRHKTETIRDGWRGFVEGA